MGCWEPAVITGHNVSRDRHSLRVQCYTKTLKVAAKIETVGRGMCGNWKEKKFKFYQQDELRTWWIS